MSSQNLEEIDEWVLRRIGDEIRKENYSGSRINLETIVSASEAGGFSSDRVEESVEILDERGYLELYGGPGIPIGKTPVQLTRRGMSAYLDYYVGDVDNLHQQIVDILSKLEKTDTINSSEVVDQVKGWERPLVEGVLYQYADQGFLDVFRDMFRGGSSMDLRTKAEGRRYFRQQST